MQHESNNVCIAKKSAWYLLIYTYNTFKGKIAIRILPIGKNIRVAHLLYTKNTEMGLYTYKRLQNVYYGSVALLWHNAKVLALLKVKYEIH